MSLFRQLWLAVIISTIIAFVGSLSISIWSARDYLIQQLERKNNDNATSLALSMTQQDKDPVNVELQVAALFDTGFYREISVIDPVDQIIVQRVQEHTDASVPRWFTELFSLPSPPGLAQVSDGWKQFATVRVVSHSDFAYQALWEQVKRLVTWFALGGVVLGALGMLLLRTIGQSLGNVVRQATALAERRFITVDEPKPLELKAVTRAMNEMVGRLKSIFAEEGARLDTLRKKVNRDAVTGLSTREYFMSHLREIVGGENFGSVGSLVIVRLTDIGRINEQLGHLRTDALLKSLGDVLYASGNDRHGQRAGRIKGGEFAVVCPSFENPADAARDIHERMVSDWLPAWSNEIPDLFHLAAVQYQRHQNIGALLTRADEALARATSLGPNNYFADQSENRFSLPAEQWRTLLTEAVDGGQLNLAFYPVIRGDSTPLHQEGVIRLKPPGGDVVLSAGDFMPMAAKLNLIAPIDLGVVKMAIEHLRQGQGDVAVNLSAETVGDFTFRNRLIELLKTYPDMCSRLLFEVPEYGAFRQFEAFCDLARILKELGCRVGIEYFGQRFGEIGKLASLGLDYIKVHPSYVRDIQHSAGNQEFLSGLCRVAHGMGIEVIALGVQDKDDLALLGSLGFDGATGPAVPRS
ncbi:MAG: EAL domain-containing protein [Azonexaceae bacterium]|uniref:EAL domain-containing protein n=1 Tax=Azonexus sp. R2A61 TaxID=2744443 RepID=UPI001F457416|nr:EAL domain-containing protein [Azonexus sp. R2A61]MCE1239292.1 EAL domain-containing protein [Azonexaceae bacterium]